MQAACAHWGAAHGGAHWQRVDWLLCCLLFADVVGPQSLTLRWQSEDNTTFTTLLTLTTSFDDPNGSECHSLAACGHSIAARQLAAVALRGMRLPLPCHCS